MTLTDQQREVLADLTETERRELARRIEARARRLDLAQRYDSPLALVRALDPNFRSTPAHEKINEALVEVAEGTCLRLLISMGSQLGKSTFVMRWDSLWRLARDPLLRIAVVSYQQGLAAVPTRLVRDTIVAYGAAALRTGGEDVLGLLLSPTKATETEWELTDGGGMIAAGVGSGLTGRPAGLLKYDDPYADRAEAYSPTTRAAVWNHWQYVGRERLAPDSPVIVTHTRWHPDDLIGQLLRQQEDAPDPRPELRWRLLNFPALSGLHAQGKPIPDALDRPPGEWLVTMRGHEQHDAREWQAIRRELDPIAFSAVYLGAPFLAESGAWSQETIDAYRVADAPRGLARVTVAVDPAVTGTGDETGIVVGGRDGRTPPHVYVLADRSGRYGLEVWPRLVLLAALDHHADDVVWETNRTPEGGRLLRAEWAGMVRDAQVLRGLTGDASSVTPDEEILDAAARALVRAVTAADLTGEEPDDSAERDRVATRLRDLWPYADRVLRHGHTCPFRLVPVTATRGKMTRADPVVQAYTPGRVHHVGRFVDLESQLVSWLPGMDSPDRLDADVWLVTHLLAIGGPARVSRPDRLPPIATRSTGRAGRR